MRIHWVIYHHCLVIDGKTHVEMSFTLFIHHSLRPMRWVLCGRLTAEVIRKMLRQLNHDRSTYIKFLWRCLTQYAAIPSLLFMRHVHYLCIATLTMNSIRATKFWTQQQSTWAYYSVCGDFDLLYDCICIVFSLRLFFARWLSKSWLLNGWSDQTTGRNHDNTKFTVLS